MAVTIQYKIAGVARIGIAVMKVTFSFGPSHNQDRRCQTSVPNPMQSPAIAMVKVTQQSLPKTRIMPVRSAPPSVSAALSS